jgi:hypothetical protein
MNNIHNFHECQIHEFKTLTKLEENISLTDTNLYITNNDKIEENDLFYTNFMNKKRILRYNKQVIPFPGDRKVISSTFITGNISVESGLPQIPKDFVSDYFNHCKIDLIMKTCLVAHEVTSNTLVIDDNNFIIIKLIKNN